MVKTLVMLSLLFIANVATAATSLTSQKEVTAAFAKHRPMVIMFTAEWCGWCKITKPEYAEAEQILNGKVDFYTIDLDQANLKMSKQLSGIPAFVVGKSEKDIRSAKSLKSGFMKADQIVKYILKYTN